MGRHAHDVMNQMAILEGQRMYSKDRLVNRLEGMLKEKGIKVEKNKVIGMTEVEYYLPVYKVAVTFRWLTRMKFLELSRHGVKLFRLVIEGKIDELNRLIDGIDRYLAGIDQYDCSERTMDKIGFNAELIRSLNDQQMENADIRA